MSIFVFSTWKVKDIDLYSSHVIGESGSSLLFWIASCSSWQIVFDVRARHICTYIYIYIYIYPNADIHTGTDRLNMIQTMSSCNTGGCSSINWRAKLNVVEMVSEEAKRTLNRNWTTSSSVKNFSVFMSSMAWSRKSAVWSALSGEASRSLTISRITDTDFFRSCVRQLDE